MSKTTKCFTLLSVACGTLVCLLLPCLLLATGTARVYAQSNDATTTTITGTAPATKVTTVVTTAFTTAGAVVETSAPIPSAPPLGRLTFADGAVAGGAFHLYIEGLPVAPIGGQYVLSLLSPMTKTKPLASFIPVDDIVDLMGETDLNLPLLYNGAQITLEPLPAANVTETLPVTVSDRVVLTAAPAAATVNQLRPFLYLYGEQTEAATNRHDENDDGDHRTATGEDGAGALSSAQDQVDIAVQHTAFLRNALSTDDIPQARRHAEHIINILDGKSGFMYGDLDRNSIAENPGDSVGVRVYLATVKAALPALAELASTDRPLVLADLVASIDGSQVRITDMFDKALQIFASDTVTEANRFAGELTALVDELNTMVDGVHNDLLQQLTFPFYGPPQMYELPVVVVATTEPTATVAAATAALTPTSTVRLRPTATPTPTLTTRGLTRRATATTAATTAPTITLLTTSTAPASSPTALPTASLSPSPTTGATLAPTPSPTVTAPPTATPIPTLPSVTSSALTDPAPGSAWRNPVDGAIYLYVPGGEFGMGADGADAASPKEEPKHRVTVAGFWLQQTETTNAQYGRCVADGGCTPPANERWADPAYADHPVSAVSWQQANAYATWAGGRLPTEAEWERSCRADDERTYPWGEDAPTDLLANFNNAIGDTAAVGSYPDGQSAYGLLDLSGNLWEWTSSVEASYPYDATDGREDGAIDAGNRTVRGGSFYYTNYQIRCAARTGFPPETTSEHIGFRIVLGHGQE